MHAEQVLDMQVDFIERVTTDSVFTRYLTSIFEVAQGSFSRFQEIATDYDDDEILDLVMLTGLVSAVKAAYAYRVTPDMSTLVEWAASQLDETDKVDLTLPPTGCGIVRFDRPLPVHDVRGRTMKAHWLMWGPVKAYSTSPLGVKRGTLGIWLWNDHDDPDEVALQMLNHSEYGVDVRRVAGRWGFVGCEIANHGRGMGAPLINVPAHVVAKILADGDTPTPMTNAIRYAMALWMLLNQTITDTSEEHVKTHHRKRALRKGVPGRVSVIQLRRIAGQHRRDGESLVEWSHRWVVRGHWRWQACGEGRTDRRRIWINPHVKGPEDRPLVQTEKVYNLSR